MSWKPDEQDTQFINLIASMCVDTLSGYGVDSKETFIVNLEMICKVLSKLHA